MLKEKNFKYADFHIKSIEDTPANQRQSVSSPFQIHAKYLEYTQCNCIAGVSQIFCEVKYVLLGVIPATTD